MEELKFILDEIQQKVDEDLENILYQLKNPLAGKNIGILIHFTRAVIEARANQLRSETQKRNEMERSYIKKIQRPSIKIKPQIKEYKKSIMEEEKKDDEKQKIESIKINLIADNDTRELLAKAEIRGADYVVYEPELIGDDLRIIEKSKDAIASNLYLLNDKKNVSKILSKAAKSLKMEFYEQNLNKYRYYLIRDIIGFYIIEPLIHDKEISKIICEGQVQNINVIRNGATLKTNISFKSKDELNNFILNLAKRTYQNISTEDPFLDAVLRDLRIQATLGIETVPAKFIISRV